MDDLADEVARVLSRSRDLLNQADDLLYTGVRSELLTYSHSLGYTTAT